MRKMPKRILNVALVAVAGLGLMGCPTRTSIAKINLAPGKYAGKEVTIAGRVTNSFGGLGTGVFQVDDGSGEIWVFSEKYGVPGNGAKLAVTGRIKQGFSIGGRTFGTILRETERQH